MNSRGIRGNPEEGESWQGKVEEVTNFPIRRRNHFGPRRVRGMKSSFGWKAELSLRVLTSRDLTNRGIKPNTCRPHGKRILIILLGGVGDSWME